MGEWSDYFEDFPEENPANYVGERFDPHGAAAQRAREAQQAQVKRDSKALQAKMFQMADEAMKQAKARNASTK